MNEAEFLAFQKVTAMIETLVYGCSLAAFFSPFMVGNRRRKNVPYEKYDKLFIVFILYCAVYFAGIIVSVYNWICMLAVILLLLAVPHILGIKRRSAFLLGILFFSIRGLSRLMMESMYFLVNQLFVLKKTELHDILHSTAVNYSVSVLLQFALFFILLYITARRLRKKALLPCGKELFYLCLIPVIGFLFGNLIFAMLFNVKEGVPFQVYEQYPAFLVLVPCGAALFYAGILITITSWQEILTLQDEKDTHFVEEQQLLAIRTQLEESEQFYSGIRQMKHDMRNHLTNIQGLAQKGDREELEQYLSRMSEHLSAFDLSVQKGDKI